MSDPHTHAATSSMNPDTVAAHVYSTGAILGTFMGYLPDVAAGLAAFWYLLVIWESKTVQEWRGRHHHHVETEKPTPEDPHGER